MNNKRILKNNLKIYKIIAGLLAVLFVFSPAKQTDALEPNPQSGTGTITPRTGTSYSNIGRSFILNDNQSHVTSFSTNDKGYLDDSTTDDGKPKFDVGVNVVNVGNGGREIRGSQRVEVASGGYGYYNFSYRVTPSNFNRDRTTIGRSLLDNLYNEGINKSTLDSLLANGSHAWINAILSIRTTSQSHSTMYDSRLWRQGSSNYSKPAQVFTTSSKALNAAWWPAGTARDIKNYFNIKVDLPKIDDYPPTISFNPNSSTWRNVNRKVTINVSDAGSGVHRFRYRRISNGNNGSWSSYIYSESTDVNLTSTGTHVLEVEAYDKSGNKATLKSGTFRVDKIAPSISATQISEDLQN